MEQTYEQTYAIELQNITKRFGSVVANDKVSLSLRKGEILCVLGENGSGKTTLVNMISGIYYPEEGRITVDGREVKIRSPKDSFDLGIGMVHQHFKLVDILTAAENIILGLPGKQKLNMKQVNADISALAKKYGFELDPCQKIYEMSVSQKQTVEIVKMLYRGARILILDEPTAVLTPQEADRLFEVLRNMKKDGCSIILITHKLHEVLAVSDRVSILRKGHYIDTVNTSEATVASLTEMMVGAKVDLNIDRPEPKNRVKRLELVDVTCTTKDGIHSLDRANLTVYGGEILGIAGIAGSGQKELLEAIAGLEPVTEGTITFYPDPEDEKYAAKKAEKRGVQRPEKSSTDGEKASRTAGTEGSGESRPVRIDNLDVAKIRALGVRLAFVPEDRLGMGLVGAMDMTDNMMLRSYRRGRSEFLDRRTPGRLAQEVKDQLEIVTPSISSPVGRMSGGNVQKVLVGREIAQHPKVLMVAYPTRGIDINSSYTIYHLLNEQKERGIAVICVIEDLDVLMELCDRIAVLCGGQITGVVDGRTAKKDELGVLMTKHMVHHGERPEKPAFAGGSTSDRKEGRDAMKKEPFLRMSKRESIPLWKEALIYLAAILLALIACAGVIYALVKMNPIDVYKAIFDGALGSKRRIWITIRDTLTLLCIGVGLAPAFRMRFWNIGAEGQILIGGVAAAALMINLADKIPNAVLILLMFAAAAAAGMIWGLIPAFFKAFWKTNETLFTLMLNYVAMQVVTYCIIFWENPKGSNSVGVINQATRAGWLPEMFGNDYFWNIVIVAALTVSMFVYLKYRKGGYEVAVVGESERTARYAGIDVKKVMLRTMAISGAICGIAGFIAVSGSGHTISTSTANGRGFTAIIVAWLARFNTFAMILIAFGIIFMEKGAIQIASQYGLNESASDVLLGMILFFILGAEFFVRYKVEFAKGHTRGAHSSAL